MTLSKNLSITKSLRSLVILVVLLVSATVANAQEATTTPQGIDAGNYLFNLGLTAGYRSSSLTNADGSVDPWSERRFNEAYNLQTGLNLNSFYFYGQKKGTVGFFDELYATASGINDPFTTGSLRMRSFNSYDLKIDFRQQKYYLNRNDSILSGLHKFDFARSTFNASLDVNASDNVKVNLQYNQTGRNGNATYTHNAMLDALSAPGYSQGPFWVSIPRNDETKDFLASINWKADPSTAITVGGGLRSYTQQLNGSLLADSSLPLTYINLGPGVYTYDPTKQPLINDFSGMYGAYIAPSTKAGASVSGTNPLWMNNYAYSENRDSKTPYFFFEGSSHPMDKLDVTANVSYESTDMKPTISFNQGGWAGGLVKQGTNYVTSDSSYLYTMQGSGMELKTSHLNASLNLVGQLMDELSITGRYQYNTSSEDGNGSYLYNVQMYLKNGSAGKDTGTTASMLSSYKTTQQVIEGFLNYSPIEMLAVKAGVQYSMTTPTVALTTPITGIQETPDSLTNAILSQKINNFTPYINFNLRPSKDYRIDGRYSHTTSTEYNAAGTQVDQTVRIDPNTSDNYSVGIQGSPMDHFTGSLRYTGRVGKSTFLATTVQNGTIGGEVRRQITLDARPYDNEMSSIDASIGYSFSKMFSVFVSGEYRNNKYAIPCTWGTIANGGTSLFAQATYGDSGTEVISQNTIDRFIDMTLRLNPIDPLHIEAGFALNSTSGGTNVDTSMKSLYNAQTNPTGVYQDRM